MNSRCTTSKNERKPRGRPVDGNPCRHQLDAATAWGSGNQNAHMPVVTKMLVTQVLMMIKQRNLEYLLAKVVARTCFMLITVQHPVHLQQALADSEGGRRGNRPPLVP